MYLGAILWSFGWVISVAIILLNESIGKFKAYSITDSLTGLPNRRSFNDEFDMCLKDIDNLNHRLTILFLDIDNLKIINDRYGHEHGDQALKFFSLAFKETIGLNYDVYRNGGDEFTAILKNVNSPEEVNSLEKRIIDYLAAINTLGYEIEFSLGFAIFGVDGTSKSDLLSAADKHMYQAKVAKRQSM